MSCKNRDDPPYQGAVYLDFQLPSDVSPDQYFRGIAAPWWLAAGGRAAAQPARVWPESLEGRRQRDCVSRRDSATHGVARIYGQCHDVTDHRGAKAEWVDVTDSLH